MLKETSIAESILDSEIRLFLCVCFFFRGICSGLTLIQLDQYIYPVTVFQFQPQHNAKSVKVTELRQPWIGHASNTVTYVKTPSDLDKVCHCTSESPFFLPDSPPHHVAEEDQYKLVTVPAVHLHKWLYKYSSCPRRPTLHQLRTKKRLNFNW